MLSATYISSKSAIQRLSQLELTASVCEKVAQSDTHKQEKRHIEKNIEIQMAKKGTNLKGVQNSASK